MNLEQEYNEIKSLIPEEEYEIEQQKSLKALKQLKEILGE